MNIRDVDPRDQSWEIPRPSYRVYFHGAGGVSDEYEVNDAEVTEVIHWAELHKGGPDLCPVRLRASRRAWAVAAGGQRSERPPRTRVITGEPRPGSSYVAKVSASASAPLYHALSGVRDVTSHLRPLHPSRHGCLRQWPRPSRGSAAPRRRTRAVDSCDGSGRDRRPGLVPMWGSESRVTLSNCRRAESERPRRGVSATR